MGQIVLKSINVLQTKYKYSMASVRLNKKLEPRLNRLANITGRTKMFYIRKLIEDNTRAVREVAHYIRWSIENTTGKKAPPPMPVSE